LPGEKLALCKQINQHVEKINTSINQTAALQP